VHLGTAGMLDGRRVVAGFRVGRGSALQAGRGARLDRMRACFDRVRPVYSRWRAGLYRLAMHYALRGINGTDR